MTSVVSAGLVSSGLRFSARCLVVLVEHKQPHGRGKVARRTLRVDVGDQLGPGYAATCGDILQCFPKWLLDADAGFVASENYRAFNNERTPSPISLAMIRRSMLERPGCASGAPRYH